MRFVVYGAGAIGGVVGGRLAEHGHDVVLMARGAQAEAIRTSGLRIEAADGTRTVDVPVVDRPSSRDRAGVLGAGHRHPRRGPLPGWH